MKASSLFNQDVLFSEESINRTNVDGDVHKINSILHTGFDGSVIIKSPSCQRQSESVIESVIIAVIQRG